LAVEDVRALHRRPLNELFRALKGQVARALDATGFKLTFGAHVDHCKLLA
jgi:hypothetical protein